MLDNVLWCFCCHSVLPITVWPHVEIALSSCPREVMEKALALVSDVVGDKDGVSGSDMDEASLCLWEVVQLSLCSRELLACAKGVVSSVGQKVVLLHREYVERRLNQWSKFLALEGYENAGIPIRAAEVPQECLAKCHARARTEWQSLLSAHPRLTQGEIRNMLDDAVEEAEGRWQIMHLRNLSDINYVFEAQEVHGVSFDRVGNF